MYADITVHVHAHSKVCPYSIDIIIIPQHRSTSYIVMRVISFYRCKVDCYKM